AEIKKGSVAMSKVLEKGHESIRTLAITKMMPNYRMKEYPSFPNLFHLQLHDLSFSKKVEWTSPTKMPRLQYISIMDLSFVPADDYESVFDNIEKYNISDRSLEQTSVNTNDRFIAGNEEIQFINALLQLCPNLLAFFFTSEKKSNDSDNSLPTGGVEDNDINHDEIALQIPSAVQWLLLQNIPVRKLVNLSQCKKLSGIDSYSYLVLMFLILF
ncbi:hypothetical protein RFI_31458, partial [Reticulomyxa filosa]